jgi:hypothetical protein
MKYVSIGDCAIYIIINTFYNFIKRIANKAYSGCRSKLEEEIKAIIKEGTEGGSSRNRTRYC